MNKRMKSPAYAKRVTEAAGLFQAAYDGDKHAQAELSEAMSTSDFPILFGDALNRSLASAYATKTPVWQGFAARTTVADFRSAKIIDIFGGAGRLDKVGELDPYPERSLDESKFEMAVKKYGARVAYSWEMNVNDDLGALQRAPGQMGRGARSTEDYIATSVLCSASGPASWLGTAGTGAMTRGTLNTGLQTLTTATDSDGNPIDVGQIVLLVPPGQELTAKNILNTTQIRETVSSKTSITNDNGLVRTPSLVVDPWLETINTTNGSTAWYLLPDPRGPRPAVFAAFLRGSETPDLRVKADAGMYLGGGTVDPSEGSFERDSVEYRLRHVFDGAQGFDDAVYVSTGA